MGQIQARHAAGEIGDDADEAAIFEAIASGIIEAIDAHAEWSDAKIRVPFVVKSNPGHLAASTGAGDQNFEIGLGEFEIDAAALGATSCCFEKCLLGSGQRARRGAGLPEVSVLSKEFGSDWSHGSPVGILSMNKR